MAISWQMDGNAFYKLFPKPMILNLFKLLWKLSLKRSMIASWMSSWLWIGLRGNYRIQIRNIYAWLWYGQLLITVPKLNNPMFWEKFMKYCCHQIRCFLLERRLGIHRFTSSHSWLFTIAQKKVSNFGNGFFKKLRIFTIMAYNNVWKMLTNSSLKKH